MHVEDKNDCTVVEFPFQLRRIGAPATCKGVKDVYRLHKTKTIIGRHLAVVDIYLNSSVNKQLISRQHAELCMESSHTSGDFYVLDKSTNGTFVNDVKISGKVKLREGDTLTFGHTQGIRIQPGMHRIQPQSEFRFVLERVQSENLPPQASSPSRLLYSTSPTSESQLEIQHSDQTPEPLFRSSPRLMGNAAPILSPVRTLIPTDKSNGTDNNYHETVSIHRTYHSAAYKKEQLSKSLCSECKNESTSRKDTDAVCTWNTITTHSGAGTVHQNQQDRSSTHLKSASKCLQERTTVLSDTDNDLMELTSIISAKADRFGASDSDQDFRQASLSTLGRAMASIEETTPVVKPRCLDFEPSDTNQQRNPQADDTPGRLVINQEPSTELTPTQTDKSQFHNKRGNTASSKKRKKRKRIYAKPSKYKASEAAVDSAFAEECDSFDCCHPMDTTVDWVQCDGCDKWYHVACVGCDYDTVREDSAAFHCGCT